MFSHHIYVPDSEPQTFHYDTAEEIPCGTEVGIELVFDTGQVYMGRGTIVFVKPQEPSFKVGIDE